MFPKEVWHKCWANKPVQKRRTNLPISCRFHYDFIQRHYLQTLNTHRGTRFYLTIRKYEDYLLNVYIKNQRVKLTERKKNKKLLLFFICCFGGSRVKHCGAKGMVQYHWLPLSVFRCQSLDHCVMYRCISLFIYTFWFSVQ